jgi:hypothetical protein
MVATGLAGDFAPGLNWERRRAALHWFAYGHLSDVGAKLTVSDFGGMADLAVAAKCDPETG